MGLTTAVLHYNNVLYEKPVLAVIYSHWFFVFLWGNNLRGYSNDDDDDDDNHVA